MLLLYVSTIQLVHELCNTKSAIFRFILIVRFAKHAHAQPLCCAYLRCCMLLRTPWVVGARVVFYGNLCFGVTGNALHVLLSKYTLAHVNPYCVNSVTPQCCVAYVQYPAPLLYVRYCFSALFVRKNAL